MKGSASSNKACNYKNSVHLCNAAAKTTLQPAYKKQSGSLTCVIVKYWHCIINGKAYHSWSDSSPKRKMLNLCRKFQLDHSRGLQRGGTTQYIVNFGQDSGQPIQKGLTECKQADTDGLLKFIAMCAF